MKLVHMCGAAMTVAMAFAGTLASAEPDSIFETDRIRIESTPHLGPDVIFVPGLATPGAVWEQLAGALEGRATVHVVDVKGFGTGDGAVNAEGGIFEGVVADLATFVEERGLDSAALVGHSLGGTIALKAAIEEPESFSRFMAIDTLPFVALIFDPDATTETIAAMAEQIRDQIASAPAGANAASSAARYASSKEAQDMVRGWIEGSDPEVVAQAFYEDMQADFRPELEQIAQPLTVVVPVPDDGSDPMEFYRSLYAPVPELSLVPIADARHFVMLDQPQAMAEAVADFLGLGKR